MIELVCFEPACLDIVCESAPEVELAVDSSPCMELDLTDHITTYVPDLPEYEGLYSVVPSTKKQELETAWKAMIDDVTVHPIPYFETSNDNGTTVVIG